MKMNIMADFQIGISVPVKHWEENLFLENFFTKNLKNSFCPDTIQNAVKNLRWSFLWKQLTALRS